jgi:glutaminyl-peptide cyclotransferase
MRSPIAVACAAAPVEPPPPPPAPEGGAAPAFSADQAWEHMRRLTEIGPRASGTEGAAQARAYIRKALEALGLEVVALPTTVPLADGSAIEIQSLVAVIPGASPDLFVLATPYDSRYFDSFEFVGANGAGSGVAVLLELARVLSQQPLPYTTWVVFLDGEAPLGRGSPEQASMAWIGSTELARAWSQDGRLDAIRLLLYIAQVGDADLRIARDLRSHRGYRETFWDVARRLGHADVFVPGQGYEAPAAGHLPFLARGVRRAVLIMDTSFGGDEPPGFYADTEDDTLERCSPQSLGTVGEVTLESLREIGARLAKIDHFAGAPLQGVAPVPLQPGISGATPVSEPEAPSTSEPPAGAPVPGTPAPSSDGDAAAESRSGGS